MKKPMSDYADIEALLEAGDDEDPATDVILGGEDWNIPPHPQRERIIEYFEKGGGNGGFYRVCFTCSKVTSEWLLIGEGYECMECSEVNRTDYEKRKWGGG